LALGAFLEKEGVVVVVGVVVVGVEEKNEEKGQEDRVYNTNTSIF